MTYTIHNLRELAPSKVTRLAEIHMGDHGLLSELGFPFVLRYFEIALKDEGVIGVYALDDVTGDLIGYNIASPKPAELTSQLTTDRKWFMKQILGVVLKRPSAFFQLVISSLAVRNQMEGEADAIESLYLTVDDKYQGQKVGRTLQQALIEQARLAGYKRIVGSVETRNIPSLRMCLSNGFTIKKTFREGKYTRYRIEKVL
jgi:RimJ/RimL family protein N-acetyltransferase